LGLGLAICSRLAGLIDTDINVSFTLAESSAFSLTLPLGETVIGLADENDRHSDERWLQQYLIPVVGDEKSIRGTMPMLLELWSWEDIAAVSGEQKSAE